MQVKEAQLNRRDAMDAETDQSLSSGNLSLKGDRVAGPFPRSFLWDFRVSAVPWHTPPLNGYA